MRRTKYRIISFTTALLTMGAFLMPWNTVAAAAGSALDIYAIDLGANNYGEATYLESEGHGLLMDSGDKDVNGTIFKWLDKNKKTGFDLYLSHYHDDHDYYLADIIGKYNVGKIYLPANQYMNKGSGSYFDFHRGLMNQTINAAKQKGVAIEWLSPGATFSVGSASAEVLWGCGYDNGIYDTHSINNNSLLTKFTGGGVRFLTGGDLEKEAEYSIAASGIDLSAEIFKMNHHGGSTSNVNEFINKVNPQYAWYSFYENGGSDSWATGWTNATVSTLSTFANVFGTRYNGTIHFSAEDGFITAAAERHTQSVFEKITFADGTTVVRALSFNDKTPIVLKEEMFSELLTAEQCQENGDSFNGSWKEAARGLRYVAPDGSVLVDSFLQIGDNIYYVDGWGYKQTGWTQRLRNWYYLDNTGVLQTGWTKIGRDTYYLGDDGIMRKGLTEIDGQLYCLDGYGRLQRNGWRQISGKWYYADAEGICKTGFLDIDGNTYYLGDDGIMRKGITEIDGQLYCLDGYGRLQRNGWRLIGGKWYYADAEGICKTGFLDIDGNTYYLGNDGIMRKGITEIDGQLYCLDGYGRLQRNGWRLIDGKWYYLDPEQDGAMCTGLTSAGGKIYLLGSDGAMRIRSWQTISGRKYHSDGWGVVQTGWQKIDGKWYYLDPEQDGAMCTGLTSAGGKIYLLGSDGAMRIRSWQTISGRKYHSDGWGVVQTGWQKIDGKWYYLSEENGAGIVGLCKIGDNWYYLNDDSSMFKNGWKEIEGTKYYFNGYGVAESIISPVTEINVASAAPEPELETVFDAPVLVPEEAPKEAEIDTAKAEAASEEIEAIPITEGNESIIADEESEIEMAETTVSSVLPEPTDETEIAPLSDE